MPYRKPHDGSDLPDWKEDLNTRPPQDPCSRRARAVSDEVPETLSDYRHADGTLDDTMSAINHLHNILLAG